MLLVFWLGAGRLAGWLPYGLLAGWLSAWLSVWLAAWLAVWLAGSRALGLACWAWLPRCLFAR